MKKRFATLERKSSIIVGGKWAWKTETWDVEVLAIVGVHAMVRRKGCYPFVVGTKRLTMKDGAP